MKSFRTSFLKVCVLSLILVFSLPLNVCAKPLSPTPGLKTIKNLLQTALEPVGSTLYVWGGGWFRNVDGSYGSNHIGIHKEWKEFYDSQDEHYKWDDWDFQTEKGLDCSGYIGWIVYNVINTEDGEKGFVCSSKKMAKSFSNKGFGKYIKCSNVKDFKPGDIMSGDGPRHVYICIGQCEDKSVIFLHSSYQGVHICGTAAPNGNFDSDAYKLAKKYMGKYYSDFCKRYPSFKNRTQDKEFYQQYIRDTSYLTQYNQMRWDVSESGFMSDPDGYLSMTTEKILEDLFLEV